MRISDWSSDVCSSDLGLLPDDPGPDRATDVPGDPAVRRAPVPARARPARGRVLGGHHGIGGADPAVHDARRALGRDAPAGAAGALGRRRPAAGSRYRTGLASVRSSVTNITLPVRTWQVVGEGTRGSVLEISVG